MGQKCHPIGFRIGITEGWRSRWYAPKSAFGEFLVEDFRLREFINTTFNKKPPYAGVSKVEIERTTDEVKVVLHTARPGIVIGAKGAEVDKLREQLEDLIDRKISVEIREIRHPDLDARLVGLGIVEMFKKRSSFRRVMKQKCEATMNAGARGVKIKCSGRLGGSEMARVETQKMGSIPLQTLQANVDYACSVAVTKVGAIGIKVWIFKGMYGEEPGPELTAPGDRFRRRGRR